MSNSEPSPYIGITGLTTEEQVEELAGLSDENVEEVVGRLVEETGTTDFAIDAQGNLRTGDGGKSSELDMEKAKRYLDGAVSALLE